MQWAEQFDGLSNLDQAILALLVENSSIQTISANTILFGPGKAPDNLLLLLEGNVRVQQLSDTGREIILYRVGAGESCVLTTACMMSYEGYPAQGIAETELKAVAIPNKVFDELVATSEAFRRFVFSAFSKRITDLFQIIDEVAFRRIDIRLANKLLALSQTQPIVKITHQQLASELGTAREVISRQLLEFQKNTWIKQSRGAVEIIEPDTLQQLADTAN